MTVNKTTGASQRFAMPIPLRKINTVDLKVLVLDTPGSHGSSLADIRADSMGLSYGIDAVGAGGVCEALSILREGGFKLIVVHNADLDDILIIKRSYPEIKFAAYRRDMLDRHKRESKKLYDFLVDGDDGLVDILSKLS